MQYETLLVEITDGTAVITLNRPKALNALNAKLYSELGQVTDELAANDEVKAIIVTGSGDKAFAAGADIVYMYPLNSIECRKFVMQVKDVLLKFENLPKPTIAAVNGMALGGGCELAMCCDLRIAEEQAIFGQPEINLGIIPGAGGTQRLPRLVGAARAKELVYLGGSINAAEAHRIGLVNMVVPTGGALEQAKKIAGKLAAKGPLALAAAKAAVNVGTQLDLASGLTYEAECFSGLFATEDQKEGMKAFMEKRPAAFKGK
ncbi:MAG: crotonase [Firmicutes bacterium]|nr:crotonase [Bacillota bacterium]